MKKSAKSAIIIVNWNGWEDTIRCIDASLNMEEFDGPIFVCDNASTNDSFEKIKSWTNAELQVAQDMHFENVMQSLDIPNKKLNCIAGDESYIRSHINSNGIFSRTIYLIKSYQNGGFSYGNNIAIKLAMLDSDIDLFWMLNSDTVPASNAFIELKKLCLGKNFPLLSGSTLCEYWEPELIQSVGAVKPKFPISLFKTVLGKSDLKGNRFSEVELRDKVVTYYPLGASMIINRAYLINHGLLEEKFFLFYEELDLALRCKPENVFLCTKSVVYHKGGRSTGQSYSHVTRHAFADYHGIRSRWILAKKLGILQVFATLLLTIYSFFIRLFSLEFVIALNVLKASLDGLKVKSNNR